MWRQGRTGRKINRLAINSGFSPAGGRIKVRPPGSYPHCPREEEMRKKLALVAALAALTSMSTAAAAADGKNRKVTVQNISNQSIYNLYASPVTATNWEEDLLGTEGTIPAGQSKVANIDNGTPECYYDLKAVMANHREHVQRRVNVCAVSKWVIGDSGNSIQ
jgi:hypothetical protein